MAGYRPRSDVLSHQMQLLDRKQRCQFLDEYRKTGGFLIDLAFLFLQMKVIKAENVLYDGCPNLKAL